MVKTVAFSQNNNFLNVINRKKSSTHGLTYCHYLLHRIILYCPESTLLYIVSAELAFLFAKEDKIFVMDVIYDEIRSEDKRRCYNDIGLVSSYVNN